MSLENYMTVGGLMNRSPVTVLPSSRLAEVVHQMQSQQVPCLIVVEGREPLGIVTEGDLVRVLSELLEGKSSKSVCAEEFMSSPPVIVEESTALFEALVLTQSHGVRNLPVVDKAGLLAGVLSYTHLAHACEQIIEQQRKIIEQEVRSETRLLKEANERLKQLAMEDGLLSIGNRRAMEVDLAYTHSASMRYERPYSIVLFDLDSFAQYNDHYGREAGDDILKLVAEHIRYSVRRMDRLYRYDGEQLLLLLPETPGEGAEVLANRIVKDLADRNIPHAKSGLHVLTMSGGIGSLGGKEENPADWRVVVERAVNALHEAKQAGRNRICG
ncbi:MAG TPA: GGDEF domain-containing protein [Gammaproteobacteria bacterium]